MRRILLIGPGGDVRRRLARAAQAGVDTRVLRSQAAVEAFLAALPARR